MRETLRSPRNRALQALLRDLRKAKGLTQEDVAGRLGQPQSFVAKYECGERGLSIVEFIDVTRALDVDPAKTLQKLLVLIDPPARI
jgi:transcriptional regulator with XRE-family HTH domain